MMDFWGGRVTSFGQKIGDKFCTRLGDEFLNLAGDKFWTLNIGKKHAKIWRRGK